MPIVETHMLIHGETESYRVRPNPDACMGYSAGAVIEWRGDDSSKWKGYFPISADCLTEIANALDTAAQEAKG